MTFKFDLSKSLNDPAQYYPSRDINEPCPRIIIPSSYASSPRRTGTFVILYFDICSGLTPQQNPVGQRIDLLTIRLAYMTFIHVGIFGQANCPSSQPATQQAGGSTYSDRLSSSQ